MQSKRDKFIEEMRGKIDDVEAEKMMEKKEIEIAEIMEEKELTAVEKFIKEAEKENLRNALMKIEKVRRNKLKI